MKERYDFSKAVRGKFYKANTVFKLPVYLDEKVETYLTAKAESQDIELSDLVNDLLKKNIELIEAVS